MTLEEALDHLFEYCEGGLPIERRRAVEKALAARPDLVESYRRTVTLCRAALPLSDDPNRTQRVLASVHKPTP